MTVRLAQYRVGVARHWGLAVDGGMTDLSDDFPQFDGWSDVIAAGALDAVVTFGQGHGVTHAGGSFVWDTPLWTPGKILCVGVNYPARNEEYRDGQDAPPNPSLFVRFPASFTGHDQPLIRPPESEQLDYEGEVAIVIGRAGRRIARADAWGHIAAVTLANEGTIRDWVRHAKFNVTQGKNWDRSGALGPWLVPFAGRDQIADIALETRVNGELRQSDRTGRMIFPFDRLIEYISTFATLAPGDVILTGTPTGAGARFDPPVWLTPGDVVEVTVEGIGTLRNTVADE